MLVLPARLPAHQLPRPPPPGRFASCGGDRQVFLWDVSTGSIIRKFRGHDAYINTVRRGAVVGRLQCRRGEVQAG